MAPVARAQYQAAEQAKAYAEDDIKQGARALTGYTFEFNTFQFRKNNHDSGKKTILGQSGTWDGDDFVKPEHIQELAVPVIAHRLVLDPQAKFAGVTPAGLVAELIKDVKVPA